MNEHHVHAATTPSVPPAPKAPNHLFNRLIVVGIAVAAIAATGFLVVRSAPGLFEPIWNFVLEGQREMTGGMTTALRELKALGSLQAALVLGLLSFLYGILHAVGPGHGKFVISSYALANEKTVRRGILLSFMAALIQALSAIVIVGILALVLKATSIQVKATEAWLETASWALIALLGAWLLWGQLRQGFGEPATGTGGTASHDHDHDHATHSHDHAGHVHGPSCAHGHDAAHVHDEYCGHTHMATPEQLQGPWNWGHAWSLAFSIGIRPCTGAIGVLLLSMSLGILWAGIFATFTMAIGTAITVSALAAMAVWSRELAARVAGGADSPWAASVQRLAAIGGSACVMIIGILFFIASLRGGTPI
jgi:nickel/cobalt transporter (NicO) family protein